jgi:acetolactate synthase-1/2/3 large subunit
MSKPLSNPGLNKQDTVGHLVAGVLTGHGITLFLGLSLPSLLVVAA